MEATEAEDPGATCYAGDTVVDADGAELGLVAAVEPDRIVVSRGLFRPTAYAVPRSAIDRCERGRLRLRLTAAEIRGRGWEVAPPA